MKVIVIQQKKEKSEFIGVTSLHRFHVFYCYFSYLSSAHC